VPEPPKPKPRGSGSYSELGLSAPERISTVPQFGPLVLGKVQAPRPNVPPPVPKKPRLSDLQPVHAPRNQRTLTGVAPPPKGTPAPPVPLPAPELDSTLESPQPAPRSLSPAPRDLIPAYFDTATAERPTLQRKIEEQGDRLVTAPVSTPFPQSPVTPSVMAKAEKFPLAKWLLIIGTTAGSLAALATAVGSQITSILTALRPASNAELQEQIRALKAQIEGGSGAAIESKTRIEKDGELQQEIDALKLRLKALEPAATIQGLPPPKP
jgi:hypothetical protein